MSTGSIHDVVPRDPHIPPPSAFEYKAGTFLREHSDQLPLPEKWGFFDTESVSKNPHFAITEPYPDASPSGVSTGASTFLYCLQNLPIRPGELSKCGIPAGKSIRCLVKLV